jgi:hypothetical protein
LVPPIEAFTAICHFGPSDCMSKVILAVHPFLLFTVAFFLVPTILPGESLTVGRVVMGATGQRGNRLPLALTHHCPLASTVDGEQRCFTRLSLQAGPTSFWSTLSVGVGVHCVGRRDGPARCPLASTHLSPQYPQAANPLMRQNGGRPKPYSPPTPLTPPPSASRAAATTRGRREAAGV